MEWNNCMFSLIPVRTKHKFNQSQFYISLEKCFSLFFLKSCTKVVVRQSSPGMSKTFQAACSVFVLGCIDFLLLAEPWVDAALMQIWRCMNTSEYLHYSKKRKKIILLGKYQQFPSHYTAINSKPLTSYYLAGAGNLLFICCLFIWNIRRSHTEA